MTRFEPKNVFKDGELKSSLVAEESALKRGVKLLQEPQIEFNNENVTGFEYKKWNPLLIPFIQYSTGIWPEVTTTPDTVTAWQNGASHIPFNQFIQAGSAYDFQLFTPRDHPFLLCHLKVSCGLKVNNVLQSRFTGPFASNGPLFRKYAYPNFEGIEISLNAVSPSGKPILGGLQNTQGLDQSVRTVGPVPHIERVPLSCHQNMEAGSIALKEYLLFPVEGVMRVTVENRNVNTSGDPANPDGAFVNGIAFGYVIME